MKKHGASIIFLIAVVLYTISLIPKEPAELRKLKGALNVSQQDTYEDENGHMICAYMVKNESPQMIKSATLKLFALGSVSGMYNNVARFENLAAGDSVQLTLKLSYYDREQGYYLSPKVEEITF